MCGVFFICVRFVSNTVVLFYGLLLLLIIIQRVTALRVNLSTVGQVRRASSKIVVILPTPSIVAISSALCCHRGLKRIIKPKAVSVSANFFPGVRYADES